MYHFDVYHIISFYRARGDRSRVQYYLTVAAGARDFVWEAV